MPLLLPTSASPHSPGEAGQERGQRLMIQVCDRKTALLPAKDGQSDGALAVAG